MLLEQLERQFVELQGSLGLAVRLEDARQDDIRPSAVARVERFHQRERTGRRAGSVLEPPQRKERTGFFDRELGVVDRRHRCGEELSAALEMLQCGCRLARLDFGVGEQVVDHRGEAVVLGPLEDRECAAGVPRGEVGLAAQDVEARLRPVDARVRQWIAALVRQADRFDEQRLRPIELIQVDQRVRQ